ncbi:MAG: hypothetical protein OHK0046_49720 [Anaerolineae bacterium]
MINRLRALRAGLRRILLGFLGFVAIALLTVLLLAPEAISDFIVDVPVIVRLLVVVLVYAAVLYAIYHEMRDTGQMKGLIVKSPGGSVTALSVESARDRISKAMQQVNHVNNVETQVESVRGQARITLNVAVDNEQTHLPEVEKEIMRTLEQTVRKQLGLRMAVRPVVNLHFGEKPPAITPAPPVSDKPAAPAPAVPRRGFFRRPEAAPVPPRETPPPPTPLREFPAEMPSVEKQAPSLPEKPGQTPPVHVPQEAVVPGVAPLDDDKEEDVAFWNMLRESEAPADIPAGTPSETPSQPPTSTASQPNTDDDSDRPRSAK